MGSLTRQHSVEHLTRYQRQFLALKLSPYLIFPREVHLETQTHCTASCRFCPHTHVPRSNRRMEEDLILKIISNLKSIPVDLRFTIAPFWLNEPFLDDRLPAILRTVNRELPNAMIRISTNGVALDEAVLSSLETIRNMAPMTISVNQFCADHYEREMGLPFRLLQHRLQTIHKWKSQGLLSFDIALSRIADGTVADGDFGRWVDQNYPLFGWFVKPPANWIGTVPIQAPPTPKVGCLQWFGLSVAADGKVGLCCMDVTGRYAIGDVSQEHLLRIYNAPRFETRRVRGLDRADFSPCDRCSTVGLDRSRNKVDRNSRGEATNY